MPTQDISRFLHQPEKHYAGVRMQQGRVILDSDWNERSSIEAEDLRRTISELACSKGSPNAGMTISNVAVNPSAYDFRIANGSYYLGGMRLVVDADLGYETYKTQFDWLQVDGDDGSLVPPVPPADRIDLVYVFAWEQPVSAVEDSELLEVALGGRDTSVRMRRMRRFQTMIVDPSANPPDFTSADGFKALTLSLEADNGTFDATNNELLSDGLLSVGIDDEPPGTDDPCNIPEVDGYVGAENQAIRIELRAGSKLTWGFDNASPLYRVKVVGESAPYDTLTFITEPADLPSMPRAGQVVEILRWGSKLPNLEKVAETQGTLHKVETTYDPTTRQLVLDTPLTESWVDWLNDDAEDHLNPADGTNERYFYLRVWDRGSDVLTSAEITYAVDVAITLGKTGLTATVKADGIPGDHWIIAARPSTPDRFVPWNLGNDDGVPPHGPRRFYAPLALIRWADGVPTVDDARTRLRPLCEGGCCKVSVGDGVESHGQVATLEEAIAMLADTGGKICVLPGTHEVEEAVLSGFSDILIEGCGPRSILTNRRPEEPSSDPGSFYDPVLTILDCTNITVKDLAIEAYHAFGVLVDRSTSVATCTGIRLENLEIECLGKASAGVHEHPRSGIAVIDATDVDVLDCKVTMADTVSSFYSVMLGGTHLRMHRCTVIALESPGFVARAPGGINVRSTSRDVEICDCHIENGKFHGIALGHHLVKERSGGTETVDQYASAHEDTNSGSGTSITADADCTHSTGAGDDNGPGDTDTLWVPGGPVEDIRIHDNVIRGMGGSGISTTVFFRAEFDWDGDGESDNEVPRFIIAAEIDIARNLIEGNTRISPSPFDYRNFDRALGGIVLAASVNAWIHENTIRNNGDNFWTPRCGIGLIAAQNAVIEDNRIADNGERHPAGQYPLAPRGLRGGIVIQEATTVRADGAGQPAFPVTIPTLLLPGTHKNYSEASRESAVIVRGNEVSQPLGKALWIRRAFGPVTVTGNSFESFGDPVDDVDIGITRLCWKKSTGTVHVNARGTAVEILDYAKSVEVTYSDMAEIGELSWTDAAGGEVEGGGILFASNSVKSDWDVTHVQPSAVFICSFDHALVHGNSVWTKLHPDFQLDTGTPLSEYYDEAADQSESSGFYVAGVYVAGSSTASAVANRVIHEKYGALFSILVGPPTVLVGGFHDVVQNGTMLLSNVTTHKSLVSTPAAGASYKQDANNITLFPDPSPPAYTIDVAAGSRDITVNG